MLGLPHCLGYSPVAVHRLLIMLASLVVEHGLHGSQASVGAACGLSAVARGVWLPTRGRTGASCIGAVVS